MFTRIRAEQILFLKTYDRDTGELMTHPLFFRRFGDQLIVAAAHETETYKPDWYLNLKNEPIVEVEVDGESRFAVATTPVGTDRMEIWSLVEELSRETEKFLPRNVTGVLLTPIE